MNRLIDENDETSATIERWKWEEIEDSETEGYHRREDNKTPNLYTIVSQSDEDPTNSDRTTDTSDGFFFLLTRRISRKTGGDNGAKCTERKSYLPMNLDHTMCKRINGSILITSEGNIWSNVGTDFTVFWSDKNCFCLISSQYCEFEFSRCF